MIPRCLGTSGSVRASNSPNAAMCPRLVHTFWPFTIQVSPSRTARVDRPATSEPAPGSENSWHHTSSWRAIGRRKRAFCSSVPHSMIAAPACPTPTGFPERGTL